MRGANRSRRANWPVLKADDERWGVRSAIDAVVAECVRVDAGAIRACAFDLQPQELPQGSRALSGYFDELKSIASMRSPRKTTLTGHPSEREPTKPVIELPIIDGPEYMVKENGAPYLVAKNGQTSFLVSEMGCSWTACVVQAQGSHGGKGRPKRK